MSSAPRPVRSRRAVRVLTALALAALVAGCAVGPSQRPPVAVRGAEMPPPPTTAAAPAEPGGLPDPEPLRAPLPVTDCTADTLAALGNPAPVAGALRISCGDIDVPTTPGQPTSGRTRLGIVAASAAGAPPDRPPLLVVGDSDSEPSARHAARLATQVPAELLERYQLIGLDRRGTGSDLLDCARNDSRLAVVDADPTTTSDASLAAALENARSIVQDCYLSGSGSIGEYSSAATASDVERFRALLGVGRLPAIGVGDGATALTIWASSHPGSVGRLVLDGPPDPTLAQPDLAESRAGAAERTFDVLAQGCVAGGGCVLGPDPRATVTAMLTRLSAQPITAPDGRRLTAGVAVNALLAGLADPPGWPRLTAALADAGRGAPAGLLDTLYPVLGPDGRFDSALATSCNDTNRRLTPAEVGQLATRWRSAYPLFGATLAQRLLVCAPWPAGPGLPAPGPVPDAPPIMVIGTAADPRAPLTGTQRAAAALAKAGLVTWQGAGTGSYPRTPCITHVVDDMLVGSRMPQADTLCPP